MPKKTRKEKMLAMQRNQFKRAHERVIENELNDTKKIVITEPIKVRQTFTEKIDAEEKIIRQYFITDLRKSLLIIGAVFALEFFFYFATMSNYLKLGL